MPTCRSWKTVLECWKWRPYKVRSLISNSICVRNYPPSANQVASRDEPMLFAPFGCTTHLPLSRTFCWSRTYCNVCAQYCMVIAKEWTLYWTLYYMSQTVILHYILSPWYISTNMHPTSCLIKGQYCTVNVLLIWPFIANSGTLCCGYVRERELCYTISKGHCWKWHHEAESLTMDISAMGPKKLLSSLKPSYNVHISVSWCRVWYQIAGWVKTFMNVAFLWWFMKALFMKINLESVPDTVPSWDAPRNLLSHVNCLYR